MVEWAIAMRLGFLHYQALGPGEVRKHLALFSVKHSSLEEPPASL